MRDVRIAFVAQKPLPTRLKAAEHVLENATPGASVIAAAAEAAVAECGTLSDARYSSVYLRGVLGAYVKSCVRSCAGVDDEG
jgi:CO/xanthine dehydrogenase FAD-binding subunit